MEETVTILYQMDALLELCAKDRGVTVHTLTHNLNGEVWNKKKGWVKK